MSARWIQHPPPSGIVVCVFEDKLNLYPIEAVPQEHFHLRLIIDLYVNPKKGAPILKNTTDREVAPESIQFGSDLSRILQEIWEVNLDQGPVRMSNIYVADSYH